MTYRAFMLAAGLLMCADSTQAAEIPALDYHCPGDIAFHADAGGPFFINGERAETDRFSEAYYEATGDGVTVSVSLNLDGSANVSYTAPGGAHGVCRPAEGTARSVGIPLLNFACPGEISLHANEGGPFFINGEQAETERFSETYYEARAGDLTLSITLDGTGGADVSYTAPGGANGICRPEHL